MPRQPSGAAAAVPAKPALAVLEGSHASRAPICEPDHGMPLTTLRAEDKSSVAGGLPLCISMGAEVCDGAHAGSGTRQPLTRASGGSDIRPESAGNCASRFARDLNRREKSDDLRDLHPHPAVAHVAFGIHLDEPFSPHRHLAISMGDDRCGAIDETSDLVEG
jgi:hypothetical protein